MVELPLEPSLSRMLIDANEKECLSQALTVAAMLLAETTLLPGYSKGTEKKRKQALLDLPDGSGFGDHIQLLQIFEHWDKNDYNPEWCKEHGLQIRGMMFVKDVRKHLSQIMQKMAKGSLEVRGSHRIREKHQDFKNLRKALSVGYANQLVESALHHNGYRTLGLKSLLVWVHPSSVLKPDDEGLFLSYVVYHELVSTSPPFMCNVCAVEMSWILPTLKKLKSINVSRLSGGIGQPEDHDKAKPKGDIQTKESSSVGVTGGANDTNHDSRIQAARE